MMIMEDQQFEDIVNEAWDTIPAHFRDQMDNVLIAIEKNPTQEQLEKLKTRNLLGLFDGVSKTAWGQANMGIQPSKITLFQEPILRICNNIGHAKRLVRQVLMHEIAHYFGYSEADMKILDEKLRKKDLGLN